MHKNKIKASSSEIARFGCLSADSKHCVYQQIRTQPRRSFRPTIRICPATRIHPLSTIMRRLCLDYRPGLCAYLYATRTVNGRSSPSLYKIVDDEEEELRQAGISCSTISPTSIRIRMIRFHRFYEDSFCLFLSLSFAAFSPRENEREKFSLFSFFPPFSFLLL